MEKDIRFVGLDVHKETIAVAVAEAGAGPARSVGTIPHTPEAVAKLVRKLGAPARLRCCYEAGPCGYALYRQLRALGVACQVVAPTLIPVRPGDRVKTDRRDAEKLARLLRSGDLTAVWVPDEAHEALRDLVRAREAAQADVRRARQRLAKLLLRQGCRAPQRWTPWGERHLGWVRQLTLPVAAQETVRQDYLAEVEHLTERVQRLERALTTAVASAAPRIRAVIAALQTLRGVGLLTATTVAAEVADFTRFVGPRPLMAYAGVVAREYSSGDRTRRGAITKTGNAHLRRVLIEAAWHYRHRPGLSRALRARRVGQPAAVCAIADKAQHRLHDRYRRLVGRGKSTQKAVVAVGRELLGFMWAIACQAEGGHPAAA
jgi:transposase